MKTSNKLLLGLIVALFLIVTIFMATLKFYKASKTDEFEQNNEQETSELSFREDADSRAPIFFPVALLQPLQLR